MRINFTVVWFRGLKQGIIYNKGIQNSSLAEEGIILSWDRNLLRISWSWELILCSISASSYSTSWATLKNDVIQVESFTCTFISNVGSSGRGKHVFLLPSFSIQPQWKEFAVLCFYNGLLKITNIFETFKNNQCVKKTVRYTFESFKQAFFLKNWI